VIAAAFVIIAAIVVGYVFRPLFVGQEKLDRSARKGIRRRRLLEEREQLYETIRELDFDYRMGKVEEDDYRDTRARYAAQTIEVMQAVDKAGGGPDGLEDRVEQEIARLKDSPEQTDALSCPSCKARLPADARFCPQCGAQTESQ
jgi:transposase